MVQGENYRNMGTSNFGSNDSNGASKRDGFMALQKQIAAKTPVKTTTKVSSTTSKASTTNWGPFKDRNDFVNMHFS